MIFERTNRIPFISFVLAETKMIRMESTEFKTYHFVAGVNWPFKKILFKKDHGFAPKANHLLVGPQPDEQTNRQTHNWTSKQTKPPWQSWVYNPVKELWCQTPPCSMCCCSVWLQAGVSAAASRLQQDHKITLSPGKNRKCSSVFLTNYTHTHTLIQSPQSVATHTHRGQRLLSTFTCSVVILLQSVQYFYFLLDHSYSCSCYFSRFWFYPQRLINMFFVWLKSDDTVHTQQFILIVSFSPAWNIFAFVFN